MTARLRSSRPFQMTGRSREGGCSTSAAARAGSCAQFLPEAASGEFWGCDLHRPSIAWLDEHLSPPLRFYVNDRIPTPHPDSHFDLVYAISVFTHITREWSAWLLELHRVLKPEGLLLATFCGPEFWGKSLSRPPDENGLGMCVQTLRRKVGDEGSGPRVLHSPWWLRSHWGRAFEILSLRGRMASSVREGPRLRDCGPQEGRHAHPGRPRTAGYRRIHASSRHSVSSFSSSSRRPRR